MMADIQTIEGVSAGAVRKATGNTWTEWIEVLDRAGAEAWDHKEIVAYLRANTNLSSWWQQTVTVGYEKAKGRRVVGQTADAGFQLGAQKTLPIPPERAWALLTSENGLGCWLGHAQGIQMTEGQQYATSEGIVGEVRVVKPGKRIRLTWQRPDMERHSTLQVTVAPGAPGKSAVRFHHERLPSKKLRDELCACWKETLEELAKLGGNG
jgi:uncharacterized protein YndB with AHSA1/START domain